MDLNMGDNARKMNYRNPALYIVQICIGRYYNSWYNRERNAMQIKW